MTNRLVPPSGIPSQLVNDDITGFLLDYPTLEGYCDTFTLAFDGQRVPEGVSVSGFQVSRKSPIARQNYDLGDNARALAAELCRRSSANVAVMAAPDSGHYILYELVDGASDPSNERDVLWAARFDGNTLDYQTTVPWKMSVDRIAWLLESIRRRTEPAGDEHSIPKCAYLN